MKNSPVRRVFSLLLSLSVLLSLCGQPVSVQAGAQAQGSGAGAEVPGVQEVQDMINALPGPAEVKGMDTDRQRDVYDRLQAVYDAYESLAGGEQAQILGAEIIEQLSGWFNSQAAPLAELLAGNDFGENDAFHWDLDSDGTLVITGNGDMPDFQGFSDNTQWRTGENKNKITRVKIEVNVTSIGAYAFAGFVNLEQIELPGSLETIDEYAFMGCVKLEQIELPEGVTSIGAGVFNSCLGLAQIKLPGSLETIDAYAFIGCVKLEQIELPEGVTSIGASAFEGCEILNDIKLPKNVTSISARTFAGCAKLEQIELPEGLISIGERAFVDCVKLAQIKLPDSLQIIDRYAFARCVKLEQIELPEGLISIGANAFNTCEELAQIKLPDSLETIGGYAFVGCAKLKQIELPKGVTSIGESAFVNCSGLTELVFTSSSAPVLGNDAFKDININTIYIPAGAEGYTEDKLTAAGLPSSYELKLLYTITVQQAEGGEAYASRTLAWEGAEITLTSGPEDGWHFKEWKAVTDGITIHENQFTMPDGHVEIRPVFEQDTVIIMASASPKEGGTVSGGGTYHKNESVTVRARAADGWRFVKWMEGGSDAAADADYTFTAAADKSLTAVFEKTAAEDFGSGTGGTGSGTGGMGGTGSVIRQPFIKGSAGRMGWAVIKAEAEKAAAAPEGGTVEVDMNGVSSVPGSIFAAMKGRDVTIIFDMGGGIAWSVNGKDITAETVSSIDFSVKTGAGEIPQDVLSAAAGSSAHVELRFAHNGAFGFTVQLSLRLVSGNGGSAVTISGSGAAGSFAGMFANLFYYNPQQRRLEFVCAGRMAEDGTVRLPLAYADSSGCTLILSAQQMGGTDAPQEPSGTPDETKPQEPSGTPDGTEPENPQEPEETAKAQVKSVKLSKTVYTYSGKAKKPSVTAVDTDGKRISSKYYTVSYKNNKNVGKATAAVKFKGSYSGTVKKAFKIRPAGASIKKLTPVSGGFTARWAKKTVQTSGYQIQYSTDAGFQGSSTHSRFARKASITKRTVKKLKTGKTYYVRIRTYKTVKTGGKSENIYSAWSSAAKVKTAGSAGI